MRRRAAVRWTSPGRPLPSDGCRRPLLAAGCGSDSVPSRVQPSDHRTRSRRGARRRGVVLSVAVRGRAGRRRPVAVTNITPAGAEPHDLELTARDTAALAGRPTWSCTSAASPQRSTTASTPSAPPRSTSRRGQLDDGRCARGSRRRARRRGRGTRPALLARPAPSRRRRRRGRRAVAPSCRRSTPTTFAQNAAALRSQLEALDAEFAGRTWPTAPAPTSSPATRRSATSHSDTASPRSGSPACRRTRSRRRPARRGDRFRRANDVRHHLLRNPGRPVDRRNGRLRDRGDRPPCSTRSKGSPTTCGRR